jgi:hypothetical protein
MKLKVTLFVFTCLTIGNKLFSQGCSQCKLMAEQGNEMDETAFGTNINSGILYLMIIPYLLILFLFRKQIVGLFKKLFKPAN